MKKKKKEHSYEKQLFQYFLDVAPPITHTL